MSDARLQQALEEWLELALNGDEPEPESFALARGLPVDEFRARITQARWLVERVRLPSVAGAEPPAAGAGAALRFGRYTVLRELGRGGQADVYLAEDPVLHRRVDFFSGVGWGAARVS